MRQALFATQARERDGNRKDTPRNHGRWTKSPMGERVHKLLFAQALWEGQRTGEKSVYEGDGDSFS